MSRRGSAAAPDAQGTEGRLGRGHEAPAQACPEPTTLDATGLDVIRAARALVDAARGWPARNGAELGRALRGLEVAVRADREAEAVRGAALGALVEDERRRAAR